MTVENLTSFILILFLLSSIRSVEEVLYRQKVRSRDFDESPPFIHH